MAEYTADLTALRTAAQGREWNRLQDTLKRLLARMEPIPALEIPAEQVHAFLPRFEAHYPEAGWVKEMVMTVVAYASAPNDLPEYAINQFPQPGCGNFVRAALDLARAVQPKYTVFERYSHMVNATSNAVLAKLMDSYFADRPEDWTRLTTAPDDIDPATGLSVRQRLYGQFWLDDAVASEDSNTWTQIADKMEIRLASNS